MYTLTQIGMAEEAEQKIIGLFIFEKAHPLVQDLETDGLQR